MSEEACPDCGNQRGLGDDKCPGSRTLRCGQLVTIGLRAQVSALTTQLENALDSSKEGSWMARALDAERELSTATARASELEKRLCWYRAAHLLCSNEFAFVGHRDGEDARLILLDSDESWNPILYVLCSDTFAWACADAEKAEYEDAEHLLEIAQKEGWVGLMRWVQERRKALGEQCEPIKPVAEMFADHDALKVLVAQRDAELAAMSRECEAWRKLNEWAGEEWHSVTLAEELGPGRFGMRGHRYGGTHSVGPFWYGEGNSPQAAAIDLATKLGLIAPDGKGET